MARTQIHGGQIKDGGITEADLSFSDNTTLNASISMHGLVPKLPNDSAKFLDGQGNWTAPPSGGAEAVNFQALTADKTLTASDAPIQVYTITETRIINLPTTGLTTGQKFEIWNNNAYTSSYYLTIKQSTTTIDTLYSQTKKTYRWDGTNWIYDSKENVAIGNSANGYSSGAAIGYNANGGFFGAAIGYGSVANVNGASIGYQANSGYRGVAIGAYSYAYGDKIAIGCYSYAQRYNEFVSTATASATNKAQMTIQKYREKDLGSLSGAWQELFTDASSSRLIILAKSVYQFRIQINAIDNTNYKVKTWTLEGAIKRDGSNNTTIVGTVAKVITAADTGTENWDVQATADNTNEALKIEVKHDCANNVRYSLNAWSTETRL